MAADARVLLAERTQQPVASKVSVARSLPERMKGLLGRDALSQEEALVFPDCASIHTVGMRIAIDVIFVDRGWKVVAVREGLPPGRLVMPVKGAWGVVEMAQGSLSKAKLGVGDQLRLIAANGR